MEPEPAPNLHIIPARSPPFATARRLRESREADIRRAPKKRASAEADLPIQSQKGRPLP
jgi:hypothetical protein